MELAPKYKALWVHLLLAADIAGVFEVVPKLFSAYIGENITERDVFTVFGNKVVKWKGKGLIPAFVRWQYYSRSVQKLSPACKPHQYVLARLADLGLDEAKLDELANKEPQVQLELELPEPEPKKTKTKDERHIIPPTREMVERYCEERKNSVNIDKFLAYYEARGWKLGKNLMKDWQAAVRTWEGNGFDAATTSTKVKTVLTPQESGYKGRGGF